MSRIEIVPDFDRPKGVKAVDLEPGVVFSTKSSVYMRVDVSGEHRILDLSTGKVHSPGVVGEECVPVRRARLLVVS